MWIPTKHVVYLRRNDTHLASSPQPQTPQPHATKMLSLFRKSKSEKTAGIKTRSTAGTGHKHAHLDTTWGGCSAGGGWEGKIACVKELGYVCLVFIYQTLY